MYQLEKIWSLVRILRHLEDMLKLKNLGIFNLDRRLWRKT